MAKDTSEDYRQKALEQYGERCKLCESTRNIRVHHIDGDRDNNELGNLIPVCSACHADIHTPERVGMPHDKYTNMLPSDALLGVTDGDEELCIRSVSIRQSQQEWIEESSINFSAFVRQQIDDYRRERGEFE